MDFLCKAPEKISFSGAFCYSWIVCGFCGDPRPSNEKERNLPMKILNRMQRKFGKYAVKNLSTIVIALYVAGYIMEVAAPSVLDFCRLSPLLIFRGGQWWRIFTWVFVPPTSLDIFTIIMLFFYYSIAKVLERTWGDFLFNVYIFGGMILTLIGALLLYPVCMAIGTQNALLNLQAVPYCCSTYYINMSIFLAFALTYPDMQVLLYFFIPVKMKWMGWLYGAFLVYDFIRMPYWAGRVLMIISLLNFIIYFLMTKDLRRLSPQEFRRRAEYRRKTGQGSSWGGTSAGGTPRQGSAGAGRSSGAGRSRAQKIYPGGAHHRCTICGRTDVTNPELEFRYCSKCEGSYEYCNDHLFTHRHIKNGVPTDDVVETVTDFREAGDDPKQGS